MRGRDANMGEAFRRNSILLKTTCGRGPLLKRFPRRQSVVIQSVRKTCLADADSRGTVSAVAPAVCQTRFQAQEKGQLIKCSAV